MSSRGKRRRRLQCIRGLAQLVKRSRPLTTSLAIIVVGAIIAIVAGAVPVEADSTSAHDEPTRRSALNRGEADGRPEQASRAATGDADGVTEAALIADRVGQWLPGSSTASGSLDEAARLVPLTDWGAISRSGASAESAAALVRGTAVSGAATLPRTLPLTTPEPSPSPTREPTATPEPAPLGSLTPAATPTSAPTTDTIVTPEPTPTLADGDGRVASDRFVSVDGDDRSDGSRDAPWRTLAHAAAAVPVGGTVWVGAGRYDSFEISRSDIAIRGELDAVAIVSGGKYGVQVHSATRVSISGLNFVDGPDRWGSGVRVDDSSDVLIEHNVMTNNHSFGIKVKNSERVTIRDNDISGNDTGIELSGAVPGVVIEDNRIHHNNRMVTSSRGGNGIVFHKTSGPVSVRNNLIWGNRAPHLDDSGYDGGAFEIFASSDLMIVDNVVWDNNNVVETGTDGSLPCNNIRFVRNVAFGASSVAGESVGLILRCASNTIVAHNTFDGLDWFAFYVAGSPSEFSGSIEGLMIVNNIAINGRAYSLTTMIPESVVIDWNLVHNPGSQAAYGAYLAYVEGVGNTRDFAELQRWTGYEVHGLNADPLVVDASSRDYRLSADSPAIDRGFEVLGDAYVGSGADIGYLEWSP